MSEFPAILGLTDIINRWIYTREGVRLLMKYDPEFPAPAGSINGGRNRFWLTSDIALYESTRRWLTDPSAKARHMQIAFLKKLKMEDMD